MKVIFPVTIFPSVIQSLMSVRNQELKGNINYALTRILTVLQPDWKAFNDIRQPLVQKYQGYLAEIQERLKDDKESLRKEIIANDMALNDEYQETFKDQTIEAEIKPLKEEWLDDMKLNGNDGDIIAIFIEQEPTIEVVK